MSINHRNKGKVLMTYFLFVKIAFHVKSSTVHYVYRIVYINTS